jgi:hypothetical protein
MYTLSLHDALPIYLTGLIPNQQLNVGRGVKFNSILALGGIRKFYAKISLSVQVTSFKRLREGLYNACYPSNALNCKCD